MAREIVFKIWHGTTNISVTGARIVLGAETKYTDGEGKAIFYPAAVGTFAYSVERAGYDPQLGTAQNLPDIAVFYQLYLNPTAAPPPPAGPSGTYLDCSARPGGKPFPQAGPGYCYAPGYPDVYSGTWRPVPKTTEELSQEVEALRGRVDAVAGTLDWFKQEAADLRKSLVDIWSKLEAWLIERIVGILIKGLNLQLEEEKKRGRI